MYNTLYYVFLILFIFSIPINHSNHGNDVYFISKVSAFWSNLPLVLIKVTVEGAEYMHGAVGMGEMLDQCWPKVTHVDRALN